MSIRTGATPMTIVLWLMFFMSAMLPSALGEDRPVVRDSSSRQARGAVQRTATIHWQRVPLRDALARLEKLFDESIFLDRRIDWSVRISLDIQASSVEEVLTPLADERGWGVSRLGRVVYLGPRSAAERLKAVAAARAEEVARLPGGQGAALSRKRQLKWPRLTEPRGLVTSLIEQNGWRVAGAERIPHDLWAASGLPELTLAEQLTVLLVGFDLTFEIGPNERVVKIMPLKKSEFVARGADGPSRPAPAREAPSPQGTKQVYTLRVAEKPVGAVLRELAQRLNWQIEFDEAAIRAAGRSLEKRVSFAVENVDQDALLDALLRPAGLDFRRDDERIRIVPRDAAIERP